MIRTLSNVTTSKGSVAPEHLFWVSIEPRPPIPGVQGIFASPNEAQDFVRTWTNKNCTGLVTMGGYNTIFFASEDDAILFWLTFK